jgi:hypothetical protein
MCCTAPPGRSPPPTPDDALYETLVGDAAAPAVPGYDQGLQADLYTANGVTDEHAHLAYGTLGFTIEMSTWSGSSG